MSSLLPLIKTPEDLKTLTQSELTQLAVELRGEILRVVSVCGGHLASNLGVIELTIALHRVFSSPKDLFIWDVGHQVYAHKILTGRGEQFALLRRRGGLSGFPKREESPHDGFNTGHASTSISAASGILRGYKLQKKEGKVIAIIGDGALTGGLAFEGLANVAGLKDDLIVIVNDNAMSINRNTGFFSEYLSRFTVRNEYQRFKYLFDKGVGKIPVIGKELNRLIWRIKRAIKGLFYKNNFFVELGFKYVGPLNGHNERELETVLKNVKSLHTPVVVHIQTKKGKGYRIAENNPVTFHGIGPFNLDNGTTKTHAVHTFSEVFGQALTDLAHHNSDITTVTAAMMSGSGLTPFKESHPDRFFDVGIAEGHAVTFAAGLAAAGLRPVIGIYSTFLQRAVDQIIHDVALQNLPVVFAVDRAGAVPADGETHQGFYDISLLQSVPNLSILAPASEMELKAMLCWVFSQSKPAAIRYPKAYVPVEIPAFSLPVTYGRGVFSSLSSSRILLVYTGSLHEQVEQARSSLEKDGVFVDTYNLRFIKPIQEEYFLQTVSPYEYVFFIEEGAKLGGIGEHLTSVMSAASLAIQTHRCGFSDYVYEQGTRDEILTEAGLSAKTIKKTVLDYICKNPITAAPSDACAEHC